MKLSDEQQMQLHPICLNLPLWCVYGSNVSSVIVKWDALKSLSWFKQSFKEYNSSPGESAVGKSSLVLRFVKGQFHEFQVNPKLRGK